MLRDDAGALRRHGRVSAGAWTIAAACKVSAIGVCYVRLLCHACECRVPAMETRGNGGCTPRYCMFSRKRSAFQRQMGRANHGCGMCSPWRCCHGSAMSLPCICHVLPCRCSVCWHVFAMASPCLCHDVLPCRCPVVCHVFAMVLPVLPCGCPACCHVFALALPCLAMVLTFFAMMLPCLAMFYHAVALSI